MEEFRSTIVELIKYQQQNQLEQQKLMDEKLLKLHERVEEQQSKNQKVMEELSKDFQRKTLQQQEQFEKMLTRHQKDQMTLLEIATSKKSENDNVFLQSAIWSAIENFIYAPDEGTTFATYYRRYRDVYETDCRQWSEGKKVRLLLRKLGTNEHSKFVDYILPKRTSELTFAEAVDSLTE